MLSLSLTSKRGLVWLLGLGCDASEMSPLAALPVDEGTVLCDPVVPDDDRAGLPPDAGLEVGAVREVVVEEFEQRVGLFLFQADNVASDWIPVSHMRPEEEKTRHLH